MINDHDHGNQAYEDGEQPEPYDWEKVIQHCDRCRTIASCKLTGGDCPYYNRDPYAGVAGDPA